jgi:hypothetical protein
MLEEQVASDLNLISAFLAKRDVPDLTPAELRRLIGAPKADLLLLLGSSVIATIEAAAKAFKDGIAEALLISGGEGHSTPYLRSAVADHPRYRRLPTAGLSEAEIFGAIAAEYHGVDPSVLLLENKSTNCGANAAESLRLVTELERRAGSIILMQDPTMQLRTEAAFRRVWRGRNARFISYACFVPCITNKNGELCFRLPEGAIGPQWDLENFIALVLGEIPRLRDDANGYGPQGRGFIEHVEIPDSVAAAHRRLLDRFPAGADRRNIPST